MSSDPLDALSAEDRATLEECWRWLKVPQKSPVGMAGMPQAETFDTLAKRIWNKRRRGNDKRG
jgi:hypothetical protein